MAEKKKLKLVVAGNYSQYKSYLIESGETPKTARFVCFPEHLRGYGRGQVEVVFYGTSYENPVWRDDYLNILTMPVDSPTASG